MKKTFEVIFVLLITLFILSGPIVLILGILTKNMLYIDLFLIYAVITLTIYYLNQIGKWAESLGKKE